MRAIKCVLAVLALLIMLSCSVSKNRIVRMRESTLSDFSLTSFNGDYYVTSVFCAEKLYNAVSSPPSLWETLYSCKASLVKPGEGDTTKVSAKSHVNLNFDGKETLTVSLFDSTKLVKQMALKARVVKNNLAIKRNLFLIPIPLVFYIRHERRVLLGINSDKSLNVGFSKIDEGQIFFGARDNYLYTLYYPKKGK